MRRDKLVVLVLATAIAALTVTACGDRDTPADESTQSRPVSQPPSTQSTGQGSTGEQATGPASAGDKNPDAPDDAISERPGGPKPVSP